MVREYEGKGGDLSNQVKEYYEKMVVMGQEI
jgi:hypothetical protein